MHWDLFCRVVDNFGDIGVCWRLAADLAARGDAVRLWCDDASALAWMAPDGAPGVEVRPWPTEDDTSIDPGEAVIEAFGCRLPEGYLRRMAAREPRPAWINLEYLSAEDYVERNHGLRSPQSSGPASGLDKWFFYPGFSPRTGGLLREPDLARRQSHFHPALWLRGRGIGDPAHGLGCHHQRDNPEHKHHQGPAEGRELPRDDPAKALKGSRSDQWLGNFRQPGQLGNLH